MLRSYGREGLAAMIREHVRLAQDLRPPSGGRPALRAVVPGRFSVVSFRYKGTDDENLRLSGRVNAAGDIFISGTVLNGRFILRLAMGNYLTTESHIERAWELVSGGV